MTTLIKTKQWLFFDLGSTLIDEDDYLRQRDAVLYELIAGIDSTVNEETYGEALLAIKASLPVSVSKAVLQRFVPDGALRDSLHQRYKERLSPYAAASRKLYGDTLTVLPVLAAEINLGIIADQERWVRQALADQWQIARYFNVIVLSDEVGLSKPDQRLFETALAKANCASENAIMLGDRPDKDIAPANQLGMTTIRILRGLDFRSSQPRNDLERADFEIENLAQLASLVV